jgi:hypothetical protein
MTALSLAVLLGAAGVAILFADGVREKSAIQAALDAGVLAGTAMPHGTSSIQRVAAAEASFYANFEKGVFGDKEVVEFFADGTPKPAFTVAGVSVSGTASFSVKNTLGAAIGITKLDVKSIAQAEKLDSDPVCVLALNKSNPSSVFVYGRAQFNAKDCAIQANSTSSSGLQLDGNHSSATASQFGVSGGYGGTGDNWVPTPITGTEPIEDPYATLPIPEPGACVNTAGKLKKSSFVLAPGTYCGGLSIAAGAKVTLEPGIYIIKDGQLAIGSQAIVTGNEVTIAFVGANAYLDMKSDATLTITSPTSGVYNNIQMLSDRDVSKSKFNEEWATILSGATLEYDGVIYLPEQQFWVSGTSHDAIVRGSSPSMIMVVDTVWAQGNAIFDLRREDKRGTGGDGMVATFGYGAHLVR